MKSNSYLLISQTSQTSQTSQGFVLPLSMVMLIIVTLVGAMTIKHTGLADQSSNSTRSTQTAELAAVLALRYCEEITRDSIENDTSSFIDSKKIIGTTVTNTDDFKAGAWNKLQNWSSTGANVIKLDNRAGDLKVKPTCMIEPIEAGNQYLITARGFSNNAVLNTDGSLTEGSEFWMQSILTKGVPSVTAQGGLK